MKEKKINSLIECLDAFTGLECWGQISGLITGSHINLHFGEKIKKARKSENQNLTEDQRNFEGEIMLFIEDCVWRVDNADKVLSSSSDPSSGQQMYVGLNQLIGQKVISYDLSFPGLDLTLHFTNSLTLRLFCNQTDESESYDNYTIFWQGRAYCVSTRSKFVVE